MAARESGPRSCTLTRATTSPLPQSTQKWGITARIARRGIESSERLGLYRWVVERTLSWTNPFRRLKVRYERRTDINQVFLELGCALICWNHAQRFLRRGAW